MSKILSMEESFMRFTDERLDSDFGWISNSEIDELKEESERLFEELKRLLPESKLSLLIAYADSETIRAVITERLVYRQGKDGTQLLHTLLSNKFEF